MSLMSIFYMKEEPSVRCVLLGVSEESKAYRLYNPATQKIIVSRDVVLEEDKRWDWDLKISINLEWEEEQNEVVNAKKDEVEINEETEEVGNSNEAAHENSPERRRQRRFVRLRDYVSGEGLSEEEEEEEDEIM